MWGAAQPTATSSGISWSVARSLSRSAAAHAAHAAAVLAEHATTSEDAQGVDLKQLTLEQLAAYKGVDGAPIYMSINRRIFDVSSGESFYGPGSGYDVFSGVDATKSLAKMSLDPADTNAVDYEPADDDERETLEGWLSKISGKYPEVGRLVDAVPVNGSGNRDDVDAAAAADMAGFGGGMLDKNHPDVELLMWKLAALLDEVQPALKGSFTASTAAGSASSTAVAVLSMFFESGSVLNSEDDQASSALAAIIAPVASLLDELIAAQLLGSPDAITFLQFDSYSFDTDAAFQHGIASVLQGGSTQDDFDADATLMQAKAFYFNKMVRQFDIEAYKSWKGNTGGEGKGGGGSAASAAVPAIPTVLAAAPASAIVANQSGASVPSAPGSSSTGVAAAGEAEAVEDVRLSFEEVMALVTAGKEVPGCKKVEIHVQDGVAPSESTITRPKKPWEVANEDAVVTEPKKESGVGGVLGAGEGE
eukprot:gene4026-8936_t